MLNIISGGANIILNITSISLTEAEQAEIEKLQDKINELNAEYNKIGLDLKPMIELFDQTKEDLIELESDGSKLDLILNESITPLVNRMSSNSKALQTKVQEFTLLKQDLQVSSTKGSLSAVQYALTGLSLFMDMTSIIKNVYDYNKANAATAKDAENQNTPVVDAAKSATVNQDNAVSNLVKEQPQEIQQQVKSRTSTQESQKKWLEKAFGWDKETTQSTKVMSVVGVIFDVVTIALSIYVLIESLKNLQVAKDQLKQQIKELEKAIDEKKADLPYVRELVANQSLDLPTFFLSIDTMKNGLGETLKFVIPFTNYQNQGAAKLALGLLGEINSISSANLSIYDKYSKETEKVSVERNQLMAKKNKGDTSKQLDTQIQADNQQIIQNFQTMIMNNITNQGIVKDLKIAKSAYNTMVNLSKQIYSFFTSLNSMISLLDSLTTEDVSTLSEKYLFKLFKNQFKAMLSMDITENDLALCYALFTDYATVLERKTLFGIDLDALKQQSEKEGIVLSQSDLKELKERFKDQSKKSLSESIPQPKITMMVVNKKPYISNYSNLQSMQDRQTFSNYLQKMGLSKQRDQFSQNQIIVPLQKKISQIEKYKKIFSNLETDLKSQYPLPTTTLFHATKEAQTQILNNSLGKGEQLLSSIRSKLENNLIQHNFILQNSNILFQMGTLRTFFENDMSNLGILALSFYQIDTKYYTDAVILIQKLIQFLENTVLLDLQMELFAACNHVKVSSNLHDLNQRSDQLNFLVNNLYAFDVTLNQYSIEIASLQIQIESLFENCRNMLFNITGENFPSHQEQLDQLLKLNGAMYMHLNLYYSTIKDVDGNYNDFKSSLKEKYEEVIFGKIKGCEFYDLLWMRDYLNKQDRYFFLENERIEKKSKETLIQVIQVIDNILQSQ